MSHNRAECKSDDGAYPETNRQSIFTSISITKQSTVEKFADCDAVAVTFSATFKNAHPETNKHFIAIEMPHRRTECKSDVSNPVTEPHPESYRYLIFTSFPITNQRTVEMSYSRADCKSDCGAAAVSYPATLTKTHP